MTKMEIINKIDERFEEICIEKKMAWYEVLENFEEEVKRELMKISGVTAEIYKEWEIEAVMEI